MLATLVDEAACDEGWVFELKYDGVRLLCRCDGDDVRCISRNGIDWTHKVAPVVEALAKLKLDGAWLDGELIVTDPNGRSDFSLLQHIMEQGRFDELQFCIFDLLYYQRRRPARPAAVRAQGRGSMPPSPNYRPRAAAPGGPDPQRQRRAAGARLQSASRRPDRQEDRFGLHRRPLQELAQGQMPPRAGIRGGRRRVSARPRHRHVFVAAGRREVRQGPEIRRPRRRRFRRAGARRMARALEEARAEGQSLRQSARQALG